MIVNISGIVTTASIFQPQAGKSGKPHISIQLLQIVGNSSEIVKIKDYNLSSINDYASGQEFRRDCVVKAWSIDQRLGLSVEVFRGEKPQNNFHILPQNSEKSEKSDRQKIAV